MCALAAQLKRRQSHLTTIINFVYVCLRFCCCLVIQASASDVAIITGAAFLANVFESYLGASLQGRVEWLNNDIVNVLQISVAAALAVTAKYYL